ncbi:hypothetical protein PSHT_04208, partial [Puccinia striiformis]
MGALGTRPSWKITGPPGNPSTEASVSLIEEACVSLRPMILRRMHRRQFDQLRYSRLDVMSEPSSPPDTLIQAFNASGSMSLCDGPYAASGRSNARQYTAATVHRHMMTRPAAPNTSPSDDDEVACAGVWVTGNGDACDQDPHSDCWRILGLSIFAILVPENITCSIIIAAQAIHDTEQAIHDIAQHIGTEPSTVTVAEGITGGEVGRTSEAHTNPIDDQWVTAEKAKGEHVDLQQLIAKIPQLRDISTIQARNELKDPRDRNQSRQMTSYHTKGDFKRGPQDLQDTHFFKNSSKLKVIHDQIFWSMKNDFLNSKGMGLGFCISLPGATVAEAKISEQALKKNLNLSMNPSDILCILRSSNFQSNPNPQDSSRSDMESKKFQDIVKNISEKFTFLSARTETEAQDIPHLMMDYSISQEVMKSWNRGIIKDLKDIYVKLLYRANSGYRYRDEAYKRLILQTVDLLYKHEMIDVGLFRSFYDTDQMLESAAKNMVWYFILAKRNRVLDFSWNIKFYLDSWYSSHFRNMHEVLDPEQKIKFEYAAHQYLFRLRAWNYVGTRRWILRASAWRKTLFEEDETVKNDITLYKYLEKHPDNDPQKSSEVQDCLIGMIRYLDNDQSLSSNAWKARRVEWRSIYQVLGFIQENYQDVFLEISHLDDQLEDKLRLLRSSSQFLGNLENIRIYLNEYFPSRALLTSDLELKQPRKIQCHVWKS